MALSNGGLARSVVIAGKAVDSRLLATVPTATAVAEGSIAEAINGAIVSGDGAGDVRVAFSPKVPKPVPKPVPDKVLMDKVWPSPSEVGPVRAVAAPETPGTPGVDRALAIMFQPMTEGMRASPVTVVA